jgi:hypothetical protein
MLLDLKNVTRFKFLDKKIRYWALYFESTNTY